MSHISQIQRGNPGPGTAVNTLTGNSGGAVSPDGSYNINVVGSGGVSVVGNPGTHTLTISSSGSSSFTYTLVNTSPYVVLTTDVFLGVDSSGGAITIELPNAPATGRFYIIKDISGTAATHNITVTTVGGAVNIDAGTSFAMNTAYESIQVLFNGTTYLVF